MKRTFRIKNSSGREVDVPEELAAKLEGKVEILGEVLPGKEREVRRPQFQRDGKGRPVQVSETVKTVREPGELVQGSVPGSDMDKVIVLKDGRTVDRQEYLRSRK